jgi:unsaturated chondroitin disaccharide hydrolase
MHDTELDDGRLESGLAAILDRIDATLDAVDDDFPLFYDDAAGGWETTPDGNWCGGHWIGLLWLAHARRGGKRYAETARALGDRMGQTSGLLDSMFAGMNYLYAGFRAYDLTGDRAHFGRGLTGADAMADRFHESAQQITVGEYEVAGPSSEFHFSGETDRPTGAQAGSSDSIYTALPVLWRAYAETGEERFRDVALSHANRHIRWHVRDDGRTWNRTLFDPESGEAVEHYNALAHSDDTCWARGQGWVTAGLCYTYNATHAPRFLEALEDVIGYYTSNAPDDLVPYWDFEDPAIPDAPRDTSAAAIAASGLLALDAHDERTEALRATGARILDSLLADYLITDGERRGAIQHGCYVKPSDYAVDNELIWTQYYVAWTLHRLLE